MTPYEHVDEVIADRIEWATVQLARLVARARREGWLAGSELVENESDVEARIAERIAGAAPSVVPMEVLAERLGLDDAQLDVLWLLAAIELSPRVARLAQAFGSSDCPELSVQLVGEIVSISGAQLDELERLVLVEVACDRQLPRHRRQVRVNDRVVELARGELRLDREIAAFASVHGAETVDDVPTRLREAFAAVPAPAIIATGPDGAGRATVLGAAAGATLRVRMPEVARDARAARLVRIAIREAALFAVAPMFEDVEDARLLDEESVSYAGPLLATSREPLRFARRAVVVHAVARPDTARREAMWRAALPAASTDEIAAAASKFALYPGDIAAAARNVRAGSTIAEGVRAHLGEQLEGLATRVEVRQQGKDLVLPDDMIQRMIELVARVRDRAQVLEDWGFGDKVGRGLGVTALFSGPPGTGKTMVAGIIAAGLGLELYQVDLSKIVSKYIGETEKQLARLFDAAEAGHAIILFDEADSMFAKRSAVRSSNDRYANLEVNYLLQRLEAFSGIAILTTNHEAAIDEAFRRRLAVHVRFPVPSEDERARLWRAMMPESAPVAPELDHDELARRYAMSGGYIRNAVMRAAYLAAHHGCTITTNLLHHAARLEYEALGKIA